MPHAVGNDHLSSEPAKMINQHGFGRWVEHVGKTMQAPPHGQGAPMDPAGGGERRQVKQRLLAQADRADQHGHQPGGSGDGSSPKCPTRGRGPAKDEQGSSTPLIRPATPILNWGSWYPKWSGWPHCRPWARPWGRSDTDEHAIMDEGDEAGLAPELNRGVWSIAPARQADSPGMTARNRQSVVMRAASSWRPCPQGMTEQGTGPRPAPWSGGAKARKVTLMAIPAPGYPACR